MNLLKKIKNILFKKIPSKMNLDRLISLKENFTGQKFQWIKTGNLEQRGKIVKCKDILSQGKGFIAQFNDGSSIDTNLLNRNLMLIGEGMQPLSKAEIDSINGPASIKGSPIEIPPELNDFKQGPSSRTPKLHAPSVSKTPAAIPQVNMFSMFNADDTNLSLNIRIKLPNKKLLKLMYENADNKNKFLLDLSQYVYSEINKNIVKESLEKILGTPALKKNSSVVSKTKKTTSESVVEAIELKDEE